MKVINSRRNDTTRPGPCSCLSSLAFCHGYHLKSRGSQQNVKFSYFVKPTVVREACANMQVVYLSRPSSTIVSSARSIFCARVKVFVGNRNRAAYIRVSRTVRCGNRTSSYVTNPILPRQPHNQSLRLQFHPFKSQESFKPPKVSESLCSLKRTFLEFLKNASSDEFCN